MSWSTLSIDPGELLRRHDPRQAKETSPTSPSTTPTTPTTPRTPATTSRPPARSVLYGVLQHVGAELSAHETITAEQRQWGSIAQLAAEYETIAAAAQHDRWAALIRDSGLTDDDADDAIARLGRVRSADRRAAAGRGEPPRRRTLFCHASCEHAASGTPMISPRFCTTVSPEPPPSPAGSGRTREDAAIDRRPHSRGAGPDDARDASSA